MNRRNKVLISGMIAFVIGTVLACGVISASGESTGGSSSVAGIPAWLWAILGGIAQLLIGIGLAIAAIYLGLNILSKLLPKINIWQEVKNGNYAVGIVCAGVVIAYTQVITSGIRGMTAAIVERPDLIGFIAALISVVLGIVLASLGVTLAFKALDKLTKDIDETEELNRRNIAVGLVIAGILYGVSSMIAAAVSGIGGAIAAAMGASIQL